MPNTYIDWRFAFNEWLLTLDKYQMVMVINDLIDQFELQRFPLLQEQDLLNNFKEHDNEN